LPSRRPPLFLCCCFFYLPIPFLYVQVRFQARLVFVNVSRNSQLAFFLFAVLMVIRRPHLPPLSPAVTPSQAHDSQYLQETVCAVSFTADLCCAALFPQFLLASLPVNFIRSSRILPRWLLQLIRPIDQPLTLVRSIDVVRLVPSSLFRCFSFRFPFLRTPQVHISFFSEK